MAAIPLRVDLKRSLRQRARSFLCTGLCFPILLTSAVAFTPQATRLPAQFQAPATRTAIRASVQSTEPRARSMPAMTMGAQDDWRCGRREMVLVWSAPVAGTLVLGPASASAAASSSSAADAAGAEAGAERAAGGSAAPAARGSPGSRVREAALAGLISGALSRAVRSLLLFPLDTLRVRQQVSPPAPFRPTRAVRGAQPGRGAPPPPLPPSY